MSSIGATDVVDSPARPPDTTRSRSIHDLVELQVHRRGTSCAVSQPATGAALTYAELWDRAGQLARTLAGHGVRRGDLVAVAVPRGVELVVALLGILRAGAAYLPLDRHAPAERVAMILGEAGVDLVVVTPAGVEPASDGPVLPPGLRLVELSAVSPAGRTRPTKPPARPDTSPDRGEDPAYVSYTSGSTGRPKGVVVPHRAVLRLAVAPLFCTVQPGDRVAHMSNTAFDATTFEVWNTLTAGGTVVITPTLSELPVDEWATILREQGITTAFLTTSLFHLVARERPAAFAGLRNLVVGGEQLDLATVRTVLAAGPPDRLVNGYGPTETTTFATYYDCTEASLAGLERVPIGYPLQDTTLHVVDHELRPVPPGELGELCIGGAGVATGYLARPDLTAERFVTEPTTGQRVYRSGDLVRQLPGGALEMAGRRDRQVKLRGFRIELEEIERTVSATGLVEQVFVEKLGDGPAAALAAFVLPPAAEPAAGELLTQLRGRLTQTLPDYMVPTRWQVLDRVPLGPTGKADRAALLAGLDSPTASSTAAVEADEGPDDPVFSLVSELWLEVLGLTHCGANDNFIEAGGQSLSAVQLAHRLQQRLEVRLDPATVLLADSLAELASHLRRALASRPTGS